MPDGVVELFEAVDVEQQHRGDGAIAFRLPYRLVDAVAEENPIRQPRERVVERLVAVLRSLFPEPTRGGLHQAEQAEVEDDQPKSERLEETKGVGPNSRRDWRVREVDLEGSYDLPIDCAGERVGSVDAEGYVDLQELAKVPFLQVLRSRQAGLVSNGSTLEGQLEGRVRREPACPKGAVVRVDEPVRSIPQLETNDAVGREAPSERLVQLGVACRIQR